MTCAQVRFSIEVIAAIAMLHASDWIPQPTFVLDVQPILEGCYDLDCLGSGIVLSECIFILSRHRYRVLFQVELMWLWLLL